MEKKVALLLYHLKVIYDKNKCIFEFIITQLKEYKRLPCRIAGKIEQTEFIEKLLSLNIIKKSDMKTMSLANMYSLYAAEEAIKDSKWTAKNKNDSFRSGTSIATGMSGSKIILKIKL